MRGGCRYPGCKAKATRRFGLLGYCGTHLRSVIKNRRELLEHANDD